MRRGTMRLTAILAAMPLLGATSAAEDIRKFCAGEWPQDYSMQKWCGSRQREAAMALNDMLKQFIDGTEERAIVIRCIGEWMKNDLVDHVMAKWCSDRQLEAYRELRE